MSDAPPTALGFIENAVRLRAAHYREEAARFRSLADVEPVAKMRRHLMQLAAHYDRMAADLGLPVKRAGRAAR